MLAERVDLFEFSKGEREFLKKVCKEVESVIYYPTVYAGSSDDVEHGILLGSKLIFIDTHTPEVNLEGIKRKLRNVSEFKLEKLSYVFPAWRFKIQMLGEKITLEYWCADATKCLPDEIGVYFIKVPLPKEPMAGYLCEERNLSVAISRIVPGGYFLERECPIDPEKFGLLHLFSGELSGLSIYSAKGNLYKKITFS